MNSEALVAVATRPCETEDQLTLESLVERALDEVAKWRGGDLLQELSPAANLADAIGRCLRSPQHFCQLGTLDGVVIGAAIGTYQVLASSRRLGQVQMLYVLPGARKVGVGASLIADLQSWAQQLGCFGLEANVLPGDRLTKNFYESQEMVARMLTLYGSI